ncbi:Two-component hybrid sensor and regulator [Candidatus Rhodobacter oscarellae]|uniref:histidine kinase n=1 Tax=Candidatus Rhodobacter oscarellae TaxID=1675527 RepID=A0A0J9EBF3_9RHOB|nr:ATP-binding protein [Candidatus Rhodobacter lobularis]KMW59976.1 Two-component hybrid sensor and regulator [Candidatus Rhodobacter lobularis]
MTNQRDHSVSLVNLRQSERVLSAAFFARTALVITLATVGWQVLQLHILPLWVLAYYSAVTVEKVLLAHGGRLGATVQFYLILVASFAIACIFAWLPLYLWQMDGTIWKFAAMVLMVCGTLNIILLRARVWETAVAYLLPVALVFFVMAADFWVSPWGGPAFWAAMCLAVGVATYFGIAVWESFRSTKELNEARAQLLQSQKVEALGTLTGGISHDFNNLLSVIQGNLELLQTYPDVEDKDEFLREALLATARGAQLTRKLLAYVRKSELTPDALEPGQVFAEVEALAQRVIPTSIALETQVLTDGTRLLADQAMLQTALLNLIVNARDAMPEGGLLVLRAESWSGPVPGIERPSAREFVRLQVSDTGTGIPAEKLSRVLDPFFTTKPPGEGSGLGLAMVQGFVRQSGGELVVESELGFGTTISLFLPQVEDKRPEVSPHAEPGTLDATERAFG